MKYILLLLAFVTLGVQAQKKDRKVDNKLTADSIVTQKVRAPILQGTASNSNLLQGKDSTYIKENWGGSGSTITASDGVYMDGDTVKWKKYQEAYGDSSISINYKGENSYSGISVDKNGGKYDSYVTVSAEANSMANASVEVYPDYIQIVNNSVLPDESKILQVDTTGVFYVQMPDTTFTTPTHLMTEMQVKREIAAVVGVWVSTGDGINYNYGGRTVVNIGSEGSIHVYDAITNYESIITGYELIVGDAYLYRDGSMRLKVIACSLTDGSPTQGELSSCAGSASMAGQIKLIKDNTSNELYQVIASGSAWSYIKYTTP